MQLLGERMLGDAGEAEDVVQDVFLYLWQNREELEHVTNPQGYAMRMVRSRSIDILRSRQRESSLHTSIALVTDDSMIMEAEENEEKSALLHTLLEKLPERQQQIIEMKYLQGMETPAIEKALGISTTNVHTTISRALSSLREKLKQHLMP